MDIDVSTYTNVSFAELLAKHVQEEKNSTALVCSNGEYSWFDIEMGAQIIAEDLKKLGAEFGTHIAICGANSVNWVLTFYAIQKIGAMAMLLNPSLDCEKIKETVLAGDIEILCYGDVRSEMNSDKFFNEIAEDNRCRNIKLYSVTKDKDIRLRFDEYNWTKTDYEHRTDSDTPCVTIFTSGSTGNPKGVILSAFNLLNASAVQVKKQQMTSGDSELLMVPLFHILGLVVCLLPCAMTSIPLFIPDDIHSETIIDMMEKYRCTLLHVVPTMMLALINSPRFDSKIFKSLRCTLFAGSASSESMLNKCIETMPSNHFIIRSIGTVTLRATRQ